MHIYCQITNFFKYLIFRIITLIVPTLREMLLKSRSRLSPTYRIEGICRRLAIGDWFLLYQLGKNIDPLIFKDFLGDLFKRLDEGINIE